MGCPAAYIVTSVEHHDQTWTKVHLDAFRGAAALIVALGHARGLFFFSLTGKTAAHELTIGDEAVMAFFVLSGYLVGGSVLRDMKAGTWDWPSYLIKRLVRLWVVLIPAVFIGILIDSIGFHYLSGKGSIYSFPAGQIYVLPNNLDELHSLTTIVGNIVFLQTIFVPTLGTNASLWSLSNEFWYYLLFPMGMLAIRYCSNALSRLAYSVGVAVIFSLLGIHGSILFLTWLSGAALSILPRQIPARHANWAVSIAGVAFVIFFLGIKRLHLQLYLSELVVAMAVCALIYTVKCQVTPCRSFFYSRIAGWFSKISYSLYLTHLPLLILGCALLNTPWEKSRVAPAMLIKFSVDFAAAIAWAALVYHLFEAKTDTVRSATTAITRNFGFVLRR
ncbi:MAG TPA: acyltransferase [Paraburkholderia sp.]|jgi:peptidoglycan/LPS O-acetylase OafA/YrhL|uniref:acyltransferase family protein n=1 Tax=Paraburkholderia sp. TaxID=1926495 RepID=UPI002DEF19D3|nr:acyltransferase [Paraburkholderia sp.]